MVLVVMAAVFAVHAPAALAQAGGAPGAQSETTNTTGDQAIQGTTFTPEAPQGQTNLTSGQTLNAGGFAGPLLQGTSTPGAVPGAPFFGLNGTGYSSNSLPPTTLDSLVFNSGYNDTIYGDEGTTGPPPYYDFSTINTGMILYPNLTTGHASALPSAWGYTTPDF